MKRSLSSGNSVRSCSVLCSWIQQFAFKHPLLSQQHLRYCSKESLDSESNRLENHISPEHRNTKNLSDQQKLFLSRFREQLASQKTDVESATAQNAMVVAMGGDCSPSPSQSIFSPPCAIPTQMVRRGLEPLPPWLKLKIPRGVTYPNYLRIKKSMQAKKLATVCQEAKCPNIGECWGGSERDNQNVKYPATATIMLMGDTCTRACRFCSVRTNPKPPALDPEEPSKVAEALRDIGVEYIVMTMVDRDDLPDGGAQHVANTIQSVKKLNENLLVECLVGDFQGREKNILTVAQSGLDVYAHNIECVERVTPRVRDRRATYLQSLRTLEMVSQMNQRFDGVTSTKRHKIYTKSSIMLGVGESEQEVEQTLRDLRNAGVDFVTLGQYLQPSLTRMRVARYLYPEEFERWNQFGESLGFLYVASGPMVRSSYRAGEFFIKSLLKREKQVYQPNLSV